MKNIETKFNPEEKVWTIKDNHAVEMIVDEANVRISKDETSVSYFLVPLTKERDFSSTKEEHIYKTREELIKDL
jgi:hypothetical protein